MMPCFDSPERIETILSALDRNGFVDIRQPGDAGLAPILAVHDRAYVDFLITAWQQWHAIGRQGDVLPLVWPGSHMRRDVQPETIDGQIGLYAFDAGSPICKGTWESAYQGAQCAIASADLLIAGDSRLAFALTRPPGHHAMAAQYGGYSFINNAAVAAQRLRHAGQSSVSILDLDYHHGNGSQSIFYHRDDVQVINLHADPRHEYPYYLGFADETGEGAGRGFNLNLPLPIGTDWAAYRPALMQAIHAIEAFEPETLILSFGADTSADDPLGQFLLQANDYVVIGQILSALDLPVLVLLEGGYRVDVLGEHVVALMNGLQRIEAS